MHRRPNNPSSFLYVAKKARRFLRYIQLFLKHLGIELFLFSYRVVRIIGKKVEHYTPIVIDKAKRFALQVIIISSRLGKIGIFYLKQFTAWFVPRAMQYGKIFLVKVDRGLSWALQKIAVAVRTVARLVGKTSVGRRIVHALSAQVRRIVESPYSKKISARIKPHRLKFVGVQIFTVTMITVLLIGGFFQSYAATNTWTQTDWSGGVGTNTTNEFTSQENIDFSTGGQLTMDFGDDWYNSNWDYRKKITVDADQVSGSSALTKFPLLINTTDTEWRTVANGGGVAQADGGDILFTLPDGTKLEHQIDTYDGTTGEVIAWVEIPSLSNSVDTDLYIYYGNDAGGLDESNAAGVWENASLVLGLGESSGNFQDASANANDGSDINTVGRGTTGKIGGAISVVAGDQDYVSVPDDDTLTPAGAFSISLWVNAANYAASTVRFVSKFGAGGNEFYLAMINSTNARFQVTDVSANRAIYAQSTGVADYPGEWVHVVGTYDGSSSTGAGIKVFINGTEIVGATKFGTGFLDIDNGTHPVTIGEVAGTYSTASYDQVAIRNAELSADWIATEYANQDSPGTFYAVTDSISSGNLVSSAFDTGEASALLGDIAWTETVPAGSDIKFQMRTAPDDGGAPGTWSDWLGPTGAGDYYTTAAGGNAINADHNDAVDDRWVQYRAFLEPAVGGVSPTLSDVTVTYVANGPPEFNADYPSTAAGGVAAAMTTDGSGLVEISYSVRDEDTSTGSATPGFITPSFEYSINGGSSWAPITSIYLEAADVQDKAVAQVAYTTQTATWDAGSQINDTYVTNAQIRVTANDNEGGNNIGTAISASFILDTSLPTVDSIAVDASVAPADVTLACSDDTSMQVRVGLETDLSDATYISYTTSTTVSGVVASDTIYVQCKDAYGNESIIESVTIPNTPINLFYQDISDVSSASYRLFIAWSVIAEPSSGFANYKVYRSTDGSSYSLLSTIPNRSVNYLIDDDLSTGTVYHYKLTATDDNGSTSPFSNVVSDDPDGAGGTDLSPPSLSGVTTSALSATGVTITWNSNELSNSTVYFEATNVNPGNVPAEYESSQGVPSFVTGHTVSLANLVPGTQYYYLVTSTDPSGNVGVANSSGTFTTNSGPVISNVAIPEVFNDQARITWSTDAAASSVVYYSTNSDLSSSSQVGSSDKVTNHSVTLTGLTTGENYYFYVESEDNSSNTAQDKNIVEGEVRYYSFSTTSDAVAPVISNVSAALTGETGATIAWTTDEGATSQIEWGTSSSLGTFTTKTSVYTTQHAVTLTGLENTSTYYYRVISEDRAGNETDDDNNGATYSFTTLKPSEVIKTRTEINNVYVDNTGRPQISNIQVSPISARSARVSFRTDKVTTAEVGYGATSPGEQEAGNPSRYGFEHNVVLEGLEIGRTYVYEVRVSDTTENTTVSDVRSFIHQTPTETQELVLSESTRELLATLAEATNIDIANSAVQEAFAELTALGIGIGGAGSGADDGVGIGPGEFGIVNPQFSSIGANEATLTWQTTRPARTVIEVVNLATNVVNRYSDNSYISRHEFTIDNLSERTSYTARITAEDENGTAVTSVLIPFSTSVNNAPLVIRDVRTNATLIPGRSDKVQTIVSWKTNKPATSQIYYDTGLVGELLALRSVKSENYTTDHVIVISSFDAGSIYRVRAESVDGSGITVQSEDYSLVTPRSEQNIIDVIFENVEETFGFIRR